jgi:hypothetical protein
MAWRIATHETRPASIVEVKNLMSIDDVCEANDVLDALDAARSLAFEKAKDG